MSDAAPLWGEVISRLGLLPVGPVEDGLRYQVQTAAVVLEIQYRAVRQPPSVRVIVRPLVSDGAFLLAPVGRVPAPSRWRSGDAVFDQRVAIVAGGRVLLPRLGSAERDRLVELVGEIGAIVGAEESTLEPAVTAQVTNSRD
ncbi:MAG: hypothetical protein ABMB14_00255, partial [Myxococcota bacterium]